jgi:4-amino-4-deoxy-L-arabinose transferase-like glycosyltransferase
VTGPIAVLDHLFDLILALAISALTLSIGYVVCRKLGIVFANEAEGLSFSFFLGTGVLGLLVLVLGLLGQLRPLPVLALITLCVAFAASQITELCKVLKNALPSPKSSKEVKVASFLMMLLIALLALRAATPPHIADELIYHLPVPKQFVERGRVFASFDNSLGNVPFLIHMIYALCLMAGSDIAARLFSLFLALATATLIYGFCARYLNRQVGLVAMFAFFAAGMLVELAVTTRIDVSLAGMLFAATYAMINYLTSKKRRWLWASAVFAGFSLSIKHTAGLWLLFIGIMYLVEMLRERESLLRTLSLGLCFSLIGLAVASPWYIKNAVWFHNPIYPFVTGEVADFGPQGIRYFNSEDERKLNAHFATAYAEIPEIVSEQEKELKQAVDSRLLRHPLRLWEFFTKPNTYLMFEPYQFPNYVFLLIPLIVLVKTEKWVTWLIALSLAFVFGVAFTSWIARYLVPAYPPLTIAAAYILVNLSHQMESKISIFRKLPVYVLSIALAMVLATSVASILQFKSLRFISGLASREEFLMAVPDYHPIQFMNSQLPGNARVMTVGAQMCYGLHLSYESDEGWFATKWRRLLVHNDSLEEVNEDLKRQGFTHILYNPTLFRFAAWMGVQGTGGMNLMARGDENLPKQEIRLGPEYVLLRNWSTFSLYEKTFLESVYSDENGYRIFRIK